MELKNLKYFKNLTIAESTTRIVISAFLIIYFITGSPLFAQNPSKKDTPKPKKSSPVQTRYSLGHETDVFFPGKG